MTPSTPKPRPVILDCDPGQDDAIELLLALASPAEIEILAITTVGGNVPLDKVTRNALQILELAGRPEVPVYRGCPKPILRALETAEYVHGESGIDGHSFPLPTVAPRPEHAVDVIVELLMSRPEGTVTLVPTGPLTNIALAMVKEPAIVPRIAEIVLMGGAIGLGNATPAAEFNIWVDPHAAAVVFDSGAPLVMFGLDVTHRVVVTPERRRAIAALGTRTGIAAAGMLEFFSRFDVERYGLGGGLLHDPCTIAWMLRPELFTGRRCHVTVETEGRFSAGRTLVDLYPRAEAPANALVMEEVDAPGFFALLTERLGRLP